MRPTAWVSVLAVALLTAAVVNGMGAPRTPEGVRAKQTPAAPPSWVVEGYSTKSAEEAVQNALDTASHKVNEYLRSQKPPMGWSIDRNYLQTRLWGNLDPTNPTFKALEWKEAQPLVITTQHQGEADEFKALEPKEVQQKPIDGHTVQINQEERAKQEPVFHVAIYVRIPTVAQKEFEQMQEVYEAKQLQQRATHRQGLLARVLAGVVAVLAAVALYFRLEDATKGYYTTLLRLAAVAFIALVGAGIWLLT